MSYYPLDTNNFNEKKDMIKTTQENNIKRTPHNKPHSESSKKKISEAQKARYRMIEALIKKAKQKQLTEERVRSICSEVITHYLNKNATLINDNNTRQIDIPNEI